MSSIGAQYRVPFGSEYCLSKHALHRLAELVLVGMFHHCELERYTNPLQCSTENPTIKIFCIHPGIIPTTGNRTDNRIGCDRTPVAVLLTGEQYRFRFWTSVLSYNCNITGYNRSQLVVANKYTICCATPPLVLPLY